MKDVSSICCVQGVSGFAPMGGGAATHIWLAGREVLPTICGGIHGAPIGFRTIINIPGWVAKYRPIMPAVSA